MSARKRTREQESKRARIEIICRGDPMWSPENANRQMAIKIFSTLRGEDKGEGNKYVADCRLKKISSTLRLSIIHKYQEAGIPLYFS